jgi:protein-tyrosine phosphatase
MSKVIDWKNSSDPRDAVHLAVQAVSEGHIVAVPGDCSYLLVAAGTHAGGMSQLAQRKVSMPTHSPILLFRSAPEVYDYFPSVPASVRRFATKVWPGPIAFDLKNTDQLSTLDCLAPSVTASIQLENGKYRVSQASHPVLEQMGKLMAGPLVALPASDEKGGLARKLTDIDPKSYSLAIDDGTASIATVPTIVEFESSKGTVTREGALPTEYLKTLSRWTLLFVCTGNTCRSPMAQAMMNRKIAEKFSKQFGPNDLPIFAMSAGVAAYGGEPASQGAQQAIKKFGANLDKHHSNQLTLEMTDQADLILTMGSRHKHVIVSQWPSAAGKVHMISPDGTEIADPFGGPLEIYAKCAEQLDKHTDYWIDRMNVSDLIVWE